MTAVGAEFTVVVCCCGYLLLVMIFAACCWRLFFAVGAGVCCYFCLLFAAACAFVCCCLCLWFLMIKIGSKGDRNVVILGDVTLDDVILARSAQKLLTLCYSIAGDSCQLPVTATCCSRLRCCVFIFLKIIPVG